MAWYSLLPLGAGLAMDATAVAIARGFSAPRVRPADAMAMALLFGVFQAGMPLLGWLVGDTFGDLVRAWDHWVAFVLLLLVGLAMLRQARRRSVTQPQWEDGRPFRLGVLLALAVATSIDALAVGVTLPLLGGPLVPFVVFTGVTTAGLSFAGVYAGIRFGARLGRGVETLGGLLLIAIGVAVLVEHLLA